MKNETLARRSIIKFGEGVKWQREFIKENGDNMSPCQAETKNAPGITKASEKTNHSGWISTTRNLALGFAVYYTYLITDLGIIKCGFCLKARLYISPSTGPFLLTFFIYFLMHIHTICTKRNDRTTFTKENITSAITLN